jgi:hypothetical protein
MPTMNATKHFESWVSVSLAGKKELNKKFQKEFIYFPYII